LLLFRIPGCIEDNSARRCGRIGFEGAGELHARNFAPHDIEQKEAVARKAEHQRLSSTKQDQPELKHPRSRYFASLRHLIRFASFKTALCPFYQRLAKYLVEWFYQSKIDFPHTVVEPYFRTNRYALTFASYVLGYQRND